MPQEYETLLHRWFEEVWNKQSEATIDEMCVEDVAAHGLTDAAGETASKIYTALSFLLI